MYKLFRIFFLFVGFAMLFSCNKSVDDDLRTVPVTNNPNIVPTHGSGFPGMPSTKM